MTRIQKPYEVYFFERHLEEKKQTLIFRLLSTRDINCRLRLDCGCLLLEKEKAGVALKVSLGLNLTDLKRPSDLLMEVIRRNTGRKLEMKRLKPIISEESLG